MLWCLWREITFANDFDGLPLGLAAHTEPMRGCGTRPIIAELGTTHLQLYLIHFRFNSEVSARVCKSFHPDHRNGRRLIMRGRHLSGSRRFSAPACRIDSSTCARFLLSNSCRLSGCRRHGLRSKKRMAIPREGSL